MTTPPAECGTYAGYSRHRRLGTQPCTRCQLARSQYDEDRHLAPWRRHVLLAALAGYDLYPTGGNRDTHPQRTA